MGVCNLCLSAQGVHNSVKDNFATIMERRVISAEIIMFGNWLFIPSLIQDVLVHHFRTSNFSWIISKIRHVDHIAC